MAAEDRHAAGSGAGSRCGPVLCGAGAEWPLPGADGQVARGQLGARRWTGGGAPSHPAGDAGTEARVCARLAHETTAGGVGTAWPGQVPQGGQRPLSRVAPTCGPLPTTCGKSGDPQGQGQVAAQRSTGAAPGELPTHTRHPQVGWAPGARAHGGRPSLRSLLPLPEARLYTVLGSSSSRRDKGRGSRSHFHHKPGQAPALGAVLRTGGGKVP